MSSKLHRDFFWGTVFGFLSSTFCWDSRCFICSSIPAKVRIWSYFNTGTLRLTDLFVTDDRMNPILDFYDTQQRVEWELDEKEQKFLEEINK